MGPIGQRDGNKCLSTPPIVNKLWWSEDDQQSIPPTHLFYQLNCAVCSHLVNISASPLRVNFSFAKQTQDSCRNLKATDTLNAQAQSYKRYHQNQNCSICDNIWLPHVAMYAKPMANINRQAFRWATDKYAWISQLLEAEG